MALPAGDQILLDDGYQHLRLQRDLYRWVHDQTMRFANQGLTGVEIAEMADGDLREILAAGRKIRSARIQRGTNEDLAAANAARNRAAMRLQASSAVLDETFDRVVANIDRLGGLREAMRAASIAVLPPPSTIPTCTASRYA